MGIRVGTEAQFSGEGVTCSRTARLSHNFSECSQL